MSDGIDFDGAMEALSAELPEEYEAPASVEGETVVEDNPAEAESFTGFDPSTLPEDLQSVYRSMQGDYTRKTQEIAELRRQYESFSEAGVDPDSALQAVGFLQALNTDPDFARQVAAQIEQNVGAPNASEGFSGETSENSNESYEGLPDSLAKELEEMRAFREEMLVQQQQAEVMAQLEHQEQQIRVANPHYADEDIESIYSLAYATDGDLEAAAEQYHQMQQRLLSNYLQNKQVPAGATPAPSGPSSTPMREFKSVDEAHKAAMEVVRNIS
jgi:murein tripeptide amidase MpaA